MNIIIVGDGKVGVALTEQLSQEGHDITVIDSNPKVLEQSMESYDVMVVQGNCASISVLKDAGVEAADLLIAATSRDEINLLTCIVARKLGAKHTIARVRNPEYNEQILLMREELGLSMTVNPEFAAAREIHHLLQFPSFLKRDSFARGRVEIVEIHVDETSKLMGIPLKRLEEIARVRVLVCVVERKGAVHIPDGNFTLQAGDNIYVTAESRDLAKLIKNLGIVKQKVRDVMIVGGSRVAYYLAQRCLAAGIGVKIIEHKHDRCIELAGLLPDAVIIEADGTRQDILSAEGMASTDAIITLTNIDEENIVIAMYASHLGVPKVITKVNRTEYVHTFKRMGIDTFISPKALCCTDIVRYVRAMQNTTGGSVITLHRMVEGKAEALEFRASESTRHLGETLLDIHLKPEILIAGITHGGRTVIPRGSDRFAAGDNIVVVTTSGRPISDLNDIFAD
ncbi:MAG: Trk system potassium transporter TrkA [Subdoligranulum sp.]|nr:Trk system potassium transporter TrkA [Subdoligranulum sp.]MBD5102774.1 Trk system potassium transporter TrkA [Subdoligranulum sp.]